MKRKRYSKDFKAAVVELANRGHSANSLARQYGMAVTTVTAWIREAKTINFKGKKITVKEYLQLEKKVKRLEEGVNILKAAVVLLGQR